MALGDGQAPGVHAGQRLAGRHALHRAPGRQRPRAAGAAGAAQIRVQQPGLQRQDQPRRVLPGPDPAQRAARPVHAAVQPPGEHGRAGKAHQPQLRQGLQQRPVQAWRRMQQAAAPGELRQVQTDGHRAIGGATHPREKPARRAAARCGRRGPARRQYAQ